jgi:hypothetical protein
LKKNSVVRIAAVAIIAAAVVAFLLLVRPWTPEHGSDPSHSVAQTEVGPSSDLSDESSSSGNLVSAVDYAADVSSPDAEQILRREFRRFLQDLRAGLSRGEALDRLRGLKTQVHDAPPDIAAAAIIAELRTGEDAATGLRYAVGEEGVMSETPSYRTALLDLLGQTDPAQSEKFSRELMANTNLADEYSLGLRNLAWANFGGQLDNELRGYFSAMVARDDWRRNPTSGFLEAFDVVVATQSVDQAVDIFRDVPASAAKEDLLVGRAAFVALDRLMVANPSKLVEAFRANPELLSDEPVHRASIMSRLDVRQSDQAALLRDYLKNREHGAGELEYFADIFPNANYFSSHRLITPRQSGLSISEVDQLDRATAQILVAWLSDPELSNSAPFLQSIITRLESFTRSSSPSEP